MHLFPCLSITLRMRCLCYITFFYRKIVCVPLVNSVPFLSLDNLGFAYQICIRQLWESTINRLQRAHLICELLRIFAYTLPEIGHIHHSKTYWLLSMQQHTNSVFSSAQPPWPLWLTKLASAAWESPVGVSSPAPGDRG